jgi:tRNA U34 2-thiouridine synthase MnmA/TrmU
MIKHTDHTPSRRIKAVGLISGGLDSIIAAKIVKDLGVEVHGVYFAMPWGCCDKTKAMEAALSIGISFITLQLDERYLKIVEKPKYGYGTALNPCVDCRIHMFSRAAQYMKHIQADFVFTGEVLGQRPMSQMLPRLKRIEEQSGLQGRLLRPLSAQLLEPTIPEQEGLIDRSKLLNLSGRSRKEQLSLAEKNNITEFNPPAGGCLLTDHNFARRMKDTFQYGYRNFRETIALKWGRHFRFNKDYKMIIGRDEEENISLIRYAHKDDLIMQLADQLGPTLILKGVNPTEEILQTAAGLIQKFSRYKDAPAQEIIYWPINNKNHIQRVLAKKIPDSQLEEMKV